jgi:hypothetical protein
MAVAKSPVKQWMPGTVMTAGSDVTGIQFTVSA